MDRAEVREKIWRTIEHKWDRRRPPGGVGTTDSKTVYDRLVARGVDVPRGAMDGILQDLQDEGLIRGHPYTDVEGIQLHGGWTIVEPEWRRYEP
jgi:hypothetical protein